MTLFERFFGPLTFVGKAHPFLKLNTTLLDACLAIPISARIIIIRRMATIYMPNDMINGGHEEEGGDYPLYLSYSIMVG